MLKIAISILALIFSVTVSNAQLTATGVGGGFGSGAPAGYQGPCDVISCTTNTDAYYAVEMCVTNAYSGNVADVVDSATGNTTGTRLQCSSGTVSALVSGSACTFVTGNACSSLATTCASGCTFNKIYNQLGNSNFADLAEPTTVSSRLTVTQSTLNSRACLTGNGSRSAQPSGASGAPSMPQPFTAASVARRTANFTSTQSIINDGNTYNMGFRNSTNLVGSLSGTITAAATDNVFNSIMELSVSGAGNSFMVVNGSPGTSGTVTGAFTGFQLLVASFAGSSVLTGDICEILIINRALNATDYGNLNTNQRAANRWGSSF